MPSPIQTAPIASVRGLSAITTIQAKKVPSPPTTAVRGRSNPKALIVPMGRHGRSLSGYFCRNRITDRCAIVKDSIAPNE